MNGLNAMDVELIEEALEHLDGGSVTGSAVVTDLEEIVHVKDDPPEAVVKARDAAEDGDWDRTEEILTDFLEGLEA